MPRKKDKKILAAVTATIIAVGGLTGYVLLNPESETTNGDQYFSIASWNLQIFGPTKGANETLLNYYADKLDEYDLFIIQEIRDISGQAIVNLAEKLPTYDYILSERAGRSSSKEQYAIFYNSRATLNNQYDWTAERQDDFERPPFQATFTVDTWTFTLYTIHAKPDDVPNELTYLEELVGDPLDDTIILGDLNADGSYYDEDNIEHFTDWNWVITNNMDTTVATSDNTYDRIIINDAVENNFISAGVMDEVVKGQSDHYLVYAEFDPDESSEEPPTEHPEDQLVINEFESNPAGTDSHNEWIELYNPTNHTLDITGWNIQNNDGDNQPLSATVNPYNYVLIILQGEWLDNTDERVILLNSDNQEIDSTPIKADSSNDNNTWSRMPNGVDTDSDSDWTFQSSTRGRSNNETEEPQEGYLLINEFELNPAGSDTGNEWVELFNPTDSSIDLTDWTLKNNDDDVYSLSGSIASNGYKVITFSGGWLDNSDEGVILLNPSSLEIDSTSIKADSSDDDRSWQRVPNGLDTDSESDWAFQSSTEGSSNSE